VTEASGAELVRSDPVPAGTREWSANVIDFTTPPTARSIVIGIKRVPKFSYDDPTRGTVWFDDFVLTEQTK